MYLLEIGFHASTHRAVFESKDEAERELDKIETARVLDDVEHNRICAGATDFSIAYEAKKAAAIARAQREA
jgi:hypothetical protein